MPLQDFRCVETLTLITLTEDMKLHRYCFSKVEKKKKPEALKLQDILAAVFRLDIKASLWEHSFSLDPFHLLSSDREDGEITDWVEDER